ncbi:hypothetical protein AJ88_45690 [Mesorhizobium amorphae CCBAU 01583]|nr:hypothetical protein AJ88_45690 [Mesorhizobium amorphae CCBAU 01583]
MQHDQTPTELDLILGAAAIGRALGLSERTASRLLEKGRIPARKLDSRWVTTRSALRRHFAELLDTEAA